MGSAAAPFLRQALASRPSLGDHRRIERVLARSTNLGPPAKRRRAERAVMAPELMATLLPGPSSKNWRLRAHPPGYVPRPARRWLASRSRRDPETVIGSPPLIPSAGAA